MSSRLDNYCIDLNTSNKPIKQTFHLAFLIEIHFLWDYPDPAFNLMRNKIHWVYYAKSNITKTKQCMVLQNNKKVV